MTQWHPIFSHLLRTVLKDYYDVQTNVPVGDLPREADIIVLRRASTRKPPFRSLWSHLSRWNILEFKGRSESARVDDINLLVEVGLGIQRRLQEKEPKPRIGNAEVSFWYLANHLGKRFLRDAIELTGELETVDTGLWRGRVMGRPLWLVSNRDVPADVESATVRIVSEQTAEEFRETASAVMATEESWQTFGMLLATIYPEHWKEIENMARKQKRDGIDWVAVANNFGGFKKIIRDYDQKELIEQGIAKELMDKIGAEAYLASLTAKQRAEFARRLQEDAK